MDVVYKLIYLAVVLAFGIFVTHKVFPWVYTHIGRLLGFRMQMTPITAKRFARFRRIRRGYWSFLALSTLFVTSLFLELIVNERPLVVSYQGQLAFPAFAEWGDKVVFFATVSSINVKDDFGQDGRGEVDYRLFAQSVEDPSSLDPKIEEARKLRDEAKQEHDRDAENLARRTQGLERVKSADPVEPSRLERAQAMYDSASRREDSSRNRLEAMQASVDKLEAAKKVFAEGGAWLLPTLYSFSPNSLRYNLDKNPPNAPSLAQGVPLGTDPGGFDVLTQLLYGFRISLAFALVVAAVGYTIGVIIGGVQGYFGGWVDILLQRFVEIWGSIPFLFTIMIIASLIERSFLLLVILLIVLRSWLGITYYVRGEFYREKAKDYVQAAVGSGVSDWRIITKHILPNSLVPVVTFAPFGIVAYINSLVSLDYLGFGLPPGTPSWGALLRVGLENIAFYPHLVMVPVLALAVTLFMVVMIGEAVREAFDPKVFSRLR